MSSPPTSTAAETMDTNTIIALLSAPPSLHERLANVDILTILQNHRFSEEIRLSGSVSQRTRGAFAHIWELHGFSPRRALPEEDDEPEEYFHPTPPHLLSPAPSHIDDGADEPEEYFRPSPAEETVGQARVYPVDASRRGTMTLEEWLEVCFGPTPPELLSPALSQLDDGDDEPEEYFRPSVVQPEGGSVDEAHVAPDPNGTTTLEGRVTTTLAYLREQIQALGIPPRREGGRREGGRRRRA